MTAHEVRGKYLGKGSIQLGLKLLENSVLASKGLHTTLISVGNIRDNSNIVVTTKTDAVVLDQPQIIVDESPIPSAINR